MAMSPWVRRLNDAFAYPVERLGDVTPQLLGQPDVTAPAFGLQLSAATQPPPSKAPDLPASVDWDFVSNEEGPNLSGNVPGQNGQPFPKSGVTVGHGLDLGQHNAADLRGMGLPNDLVSLLTPYLGYRGQSAQDYVTAHPLTINAQQQAQIDKGLFPTEYDRLAQRYNAASKAGVRFQDLPQDAQTAIMDVAHQYGDLAARTPNFWNQIVNSQWQAADDNLRNFGDIHKTRRGDHANRMQKAITSGALKGKP
jgi:hypothetical protein